MNRFSVLDYADGQQVVYSCPNQCGRIYKNYHSVSKHLKYRCGVEPQFPCQFCDKAFHHRHHLKYHQTKRNPCTLRRQVLNIKIDRVQDLM